MAMNRRNVLIGMGAATAGGGALIATGAFTTVEAERSVSVETAGDDAALLQMVDATDGTYVSVDDGVVQIDIGDESAGVNRSARTVFEHLIDISNNGNQDVTSLTFEIQGDNGEDELLTPIPESYEAEDFDGDGLSPGDEPVTLGLEIELRESEVDGDPAAYDNGDIDAENFDPTLVITANTD